MLNCSHFSVDAYGARQAAIKKLYINYIGQEMSSSTSSQKAWKNYETIGYLTITVFTIIATITCVVRNYEAIKGIKETSPAWIPVIIMFILFGASLLFVFQMLFINMLYKTIVALYAPAVDQKIMQNEEITIKYLSTYRQAIKTKKISAIDFLEASRNMRSQYAAAILVIISIIAFYIVWPMTGAMCTNIAQFLDDTDDNFIKKLLFQVHFGFLVLR